MLSYILSITSTFSIYMYDSTILHVLISLIYKNAMFHDDSILFVWKFYPA